MVLSGGERSTIRLAVFLTTVVTAVCIGGCVLVPQQTPKRPYHRISFGEITVAPTPGGAERVAKARRLHALVAEGKKELNRSHEAKAETLFRQALSLEEDGEAWLLLAQIYDRQNRQAEAL